MTKRKRGRKKIAMTQKPVIIATSVAPTLKRELEQVAAREGRSFAGQLRHMLVESLDRREKGK